MRGGVSFGEIAVVGCFINEPNVSGVMMVQYSKAVIAIVVRSKVLPV